MKNLLKIAFAISLCISVSYAAPQKGTMTDPRDGKKYRTVKFGDQVWMAENLNFETSESRCYDDKIANCKNYGRLYTWSAAMDSAAIYSEDGINCGRGSRCEATFPVQGICPDGWHLPSKQEFEKLIAFAGGKDAAKKKLRAKKSWGKGVEGTDNYGFSVIASGIYEKKGFRGNEKSVIPNSYFQYRDARLWSSTDAHYALWFVLVSKMQSASSEEFGLKSSNMGDESSVRCIKNEEPATEAISSVEKEIASIGENEVKEMIRNNQCIMFRDKVEDCSNLLDACSPTIEFIKKGKNRIVSFTFDDTGINGLAKNTGKDINQQKTVSFVIGVDTKSNRQALILSGASIICHGNDCVNEGILYSGFAAKDARFLAEGDHDAVNTWINNRGVYEVKRIVEDMGYNLGYLTGICKEKKE